MKYSLLAAALVTLTFSACDQMKEHKPGEGKPGQYPPSLWEKRAGQLSDADIEAAQREGAETETKKEAVESVPPGKAYDKPASPEY